MSAPPFLPILPPPLPPGWTEHIGPNGGVYYHNAQTNESTYVRLIPSFPIASQAPPSAPKKKEKPLVKTSIPGTDWLRVKTTQGNTFYTHKAKKQSFWTVPDEIKEAVETLEATEEEERVRQQEEKAQQEEEEAKKVAMERDKEIKRIKAEVEGVVKRKADQDIPMDEVVVSKKARVDDEASEEEEEESEESEEEEEWQREAAAQLAAEAEEEKRLQEEEEKRVKEEEAKSNESKPQLNMPERVDLSIEEGKALFKTLLREKDVNPLHPWDTSLPLFISDPRYVLLPSVSARREAFDEYCRDRARELRQSQVKKEKEDPKEGFDRLLREEVMSTRTSWNDFRRTWKKDRRFYGWGRDDREREKRFRDFLKDLGEKKRAAAKKAEADFFILLRESGVANAGSVWKDVKHKITDDPRYDAVGSSSLREELFNTFLKAQSSGSIAGSEKTTDTKPPDTGAIEDDGEKERKRKERKERAVKEREEKIKTERGRVEADINKSRMGLTKEEGELEFRTLLTDAIRDPQVTWEVALPQLKTDPRFNHSPLPLNHQLHLFHTHVNQLRAKHLSNLHALFESHARSLAANFTVLPLQSTLSSLPATKLGLDINRLENEFERWQRERTAEARKAFDEMLHENSFVEFWGRLGKMGGEGVEGGVKRDEMGAEDEGEAGGGNVDMKVLAKHVDIGDVEKVLKNDKRYINFDHVPEQRERWLRDYLSRLSAPKLSMWVPRYLWRSTSTSLYSHRDVFLRELISNANDALEKLRLLSLTNKEMWDGTSPLNITIKVVRDEDGSGGRMIITDTGIGMTPDELTKNLGTLAKSGTSEFLARAEDSQDTTGSGHLIGAFGVGFYSSFLVADKVYVSSVAAKSANNLEPAQYVFASSADDSDFSVYPDPRGRTMERGTEITLILKPDALEYLENRNIITLVHKHSTFSSTFPIYIFTQEERQVPVEEEEATEPTPSPEAEKSEDDDDEATIEEVDEEIKKKTPETKTIVVDEWVHLNAQPPLWMRQVLDPKEIEDVEYELFYQATFKDFNRPLAWHHFSGDTGAGVSFRAIVFVPSKLCVPIMPWTDSTPFSSRQGCSIDGQTRIYHVRASERTGCRNGLGWVKVVVDAEDLPLNVSRETLQNTAFLKQLKQLIIRRLIQIFTRIADEDPTKFAEILKVYGNVFKLGSVEDLKNREKLVPLTRFATNQRNSTSLDEYLENKKQGQKQIFYVSDMGKSVTSLMKSVFVEKLHARGYEVFLLTDPLDEVLFQNIRKWKGVPFQDVAKAGLKFGDEDLDPEEEKAKQKALNVKFTPLLKWLKDQTKDVVRDVVVSDRLVSSPCAIVADVGGYTANVQRMMSGSNNRQANSAMHDFAKRQKVLEINPRSPLIEGLLRRVEQLPSEEEERDIETEDELREVSAILIDGALVRSGFDVTDSDEFLVRVDRVLRRSLGVSETAPTDTTVKPAPPVDPELLDESEYEPKPEFPVMPDLPEDDDGPARVIVPDHLKDQIQIEMEEIDEDGNAVVHDEL
ncbi:hypothetical protein EW146_g1461 [Bondarzewia mesenterica]|uniref:HSP90-domain-containing protein n=1 Tax=Bondarzewia mesenterica TaxID=1095465 RepID=A0A4S4M635_9AGAM|nr:hypothetical protein EW146_g1461 [Bondarzewia mesenterica]